MLDDCEMPVGSFNPDKTIIFGEKEHDAAKSQPSRAENWTATIALPAWKHQDWENQEPEITAGDCVHKVWAEARPKLRLVSFRLSVGGSLLFARTRLRRAGRNLRESRH
jgi:hypothetical protein